MTSKKKKSKQKWILFFLREWRCALRAKDAFFKSVCLLFLSLLKPSENPVVQTPAPHQPTCFLCCHMTADVSPSQSQGWEPVDKMVFVRPSSRVSVCGLCRLKWEEEEGGRGEGEREREGKKGPIKQIMINQHTPSVYNHACALHLYCVCVFTKFSYEKLASVSTGVLPPLLSCSLIRPHVSSEEERERGGGCRR